MCVCVNIWCLFLSFWLISLALFSWKGMEVILVRWPTYHSDCPLFFVSFLAVPHGLWDLSYLTRDWAWASGVKATGPPETSLPTVRSSQVTALTGKSGISATSKETLSSSLSPFSLLPSVGKMGICTAESYFSVYLFCIWNVNCPSVNLFF